MKQQVYNIGRHLPGGVKRRLVNFGVNTMSAGDFDSFTQLYQVPSMEWSLRNMRRLGFAPHVVVDVGAYTGEWTRMAKRIFAESTYVYMLEGQPAKGAALQQVAEEFPGQVSYDIAVLGPEMRSAVPFFELETGSGVLEEQSSVTRRAKTYPMRTLDTLVASHSLVRVDLLKLDVQGYELEVMKGAARTIESCETVLMEVSLIPVNRGAPILHEVVNFMHEREFRAYDICSFTRRPLDRALWQTDMIFVKEWSSLLGHTTFD
jgi:FkbM family methyltransferase